MKDRLYLGGGYEVYRSDGKVRSERHTLHISNGDEKILLVETTTKGEAAEPTIFRHQLGKYLGSSVIELDEDAKLITYEEYYPYGSTSYKASNSQIEAPPKRYRYSGKEPDQEIGLYYYGARYYAPYPGGGFYRKPFPKLKFLIIVIRREILESHRRVHRPQYGIRARVERLLCQLAAISSSPAPPARPSTPSTPCSISAVCRSPP